MPLTSAVRNLLDFCFPGACAVCSEWCESDVQLCEKCRIQLATLESASACNKCAMPIAEAGSPCPFCKNDGVPHFDSIARLGIFDDPIKQLIHQMKYHRQWAMAEFLAERLLAQDRVRKLLADADCIVAVPLYFTKQIARGFNQADLIARHIAKHSGIRYVKPLTRIRPTESQTNLSPTRRVENMRGAFGLVTDKQIAGKRVILIDDVMTTGATLQSAARTLARAKPAKLCAMVIEVADPKSRGFSTV